MSIDEPSKNTFTLNFDQETIDKIGNYSRVMDNLVCLGSHIINAYRENTAAHPNKRDTVLVLFRRIIELLDSASIQIESGSVLPCVGNVRIILETSLQLEYLLRDTERILEKCKHFIIMELDGDLEIYENTKNEPKLKAQKLDIDQAISDIQAKIHDPYFDDIRQLYESKVFEANGARKRKTIKWYSFSSKANSVRFLAENLQKLDRYYMVYSVASNITHSSRLLSDSLYSKDGVLFVRRIRDTENMDDIAKALIRLSIEAIELVSKGLLYNERFKYLQARDDFNYKYKGKYFIANK